MDLRNTFGRLQPDNSLEANLMRAWLKKQATSEEWFTGVAVSEATRCGEVKPRIYTPMPQSLRIYCQGRAEGRLEYDYSMARSLGDWFRALYLAIDWNTERLEHYVWAYERTEGLAEQSASQIIAKARDRFMAVKSPEDDIRMCLHVKKMDADARQRMGK